MARKITKEDAETLISKWIKEIEKQKKDILKNFNDMDLQNADVQERYKERITTIRKKCDELIAKIERYKFS